MMEESNKEKALKQAFESSLNEKTLELNVAKRRATTTEKARELAEQKAEDLQGKLDEAEGLQKAEDLQKFRALSLLVTNNLPT